jgi:adenylosuccinate lyase
MNNFDNYQSVFSWRYGTAEMRALFSEENKIKTWRKIWVALAKAQKEAGLVSAEELEDLEKNESNIDIDRILEIEKETSHDVVSGIREFAEKAKIGGGKIHLGSTSQDIQDNYEALRNHQALNIIEKKLIELLHQFSEKITHYKDVPCMGYTHLQPAEPTTVGYRFAFYGQELLTDLQFLRFVKKIVKGKGLKGSVGTAASYKALLKDSQTTPAQLEEIFLKNLGLEAVLISTQVNPRKYDYFILSVLNSIASSLAKFAFDLRIMQSPGFGEWMEPFGQKQVGSSALPFKKNPLNSEKICSLARYINALPAVALENATNSLLERTLDDSANKRIIMPEAFLTVDEILKTTQKIISGLIVNKSKVEQNLDLYAPFSATEPIIIESVKKGADRQEMHELMREISMKAWKEISEQRPNPMKDLLVKNEVLQKYLDEVKITELLEVRNHVGDAADRAEKLVGEINKVQK